MFSLILLIKFPLIIFSLTFKEFEKPNASVDPWLLMTGLFKPNKIAPLYKRGSNFSLNFLKFLKLSKDDILPVIELVKDFFNSLDRLKTDHVDLIQLHSLTNPDEWRTCFSPEGALEALIEFKQQGLAKFIGVTGHGWTAPAMHRWSLERYDFDSVLMPWSWFASNFRGYDKEFDKTANICDERKIAIQTIKGIARGPWAAGVTPNRKTWYQPYEDESTVKSCVQWVLSRENVFLNSVGDIDLVPLVLQAADNYQSCPSDETMKRIDNTVGSASIFGI